MPRIARKDLNTTFMYVMVQGVNKEYIFNEESDLKEYLNYIKEIKTYDKFSLFGYCMINDFGRCPHNH